MTAPTTCRGFRWVGQSFDHCDECGRDITEHDGMHTYLGPGADLPFGNDAEYGVMPFEEYERRSPIFSHYVTATDGSGRKRYALDVAEADR